MTLIDSILLCDMELNRGYNDERIGYLCYSYIHFTSHLSWSDIEKISLCGSYFKKPKLKTIVNGFV